MTKSGVYILDDIISDKDCKILIEFIKNKAREETELNPETNVKAKAIKVNEETNLIVKPIIMEMGSILQGHGFNIYDCTIPILRQIYGPTRFHADNVYDDDREESVKINRLRCLSFVIALNSDYEGGEFCFPEQDYKVKLKRGQALLFPPYWTHPHYTNKLHNNTFRYTITAWFYGTRGYQIPMSVHEQ